MRHIVFVSAFLAALSFAACNDASDKDGDMPQTVSRTPVGIIADIKSPENTKTTIEGNKSTGFRVSWEADDKLGVFTHSDGVDRQFHSANEVFGISGGINADGKAAFEGALNCKTDAAMNVDLYAYFPYNTANDGKEYNAVTGTVPAVQTMTAGGSHHSGADIMIADSKKGIEIPQAGTAVAPISDFTFRYVVTFVNVLVSGIASGGDAPRFPVAGTETIKSIRLAAAAGDGADPVLSGNVSLDLAAASATPAGENFNYVVASWPAGAGKTIADICGEGKLGAWFVALPFSAGGAGGNDLTITIETDKNKIIKRSHPSEPIEFVAGGAKTLNVAIDAVCEVIPAGDIFYEGFGNGMDGYSGSSSLADYAAFDNGFERSGWGGSGVSYSAEGAVEVRRTPNFNEHLFLPKQGSSFTVAGITVGSVRNFELSYKHCIASGSSSASTTYALSVSNDGYNWKPLAGTTVTGVAYMQTSLPFSIVSGGDKLYLKFVSGTDNTRDIRIDDIRLTEADDIQGVGVDLDS